MHASIIIKILGLLLMLFSALGNFPVIIISYVYQDGVASAFFASFLIILAIGFVLLLSTAHTHKELGNQD